MRRPLKGTVLTFALSGTVLTVAGVPALAQPNGVRARTAPADVATRLDVAHVSVYGETLMVPDVVEPPANLILPSSHRRAVETMMARSSMFRRQCLRLRAAAQLTVTVRMLHPLTGGPRARTEIRTVGRQLIATVEINPLGDFPELLAHELEHVIEQLDGIDLPAKSELDRSGVRGFGGGGYETSRAIHVGAVVGGQARSRR